jgi:hypothetical protein
VLLLLGLLSILQAAWLPGHFVVRALSLHRGGLTRSLVLSFAISLVVNHLGVFALTSAHLYVAPVVYIIFGAEALAMVWLVVRERRAPTSPPEEGRDLDRWRALIPLLAQRRPIVALAGYVSILALVCMIIVFAVGMAQSTPRVISSWDAVVSWNRWACDWAANRLPERTWHYPQLLPTTSSLTYVFTRDASVQFFAKFIFGLFPLAMLLACWDLMLRLQDVRYGAGGALGGYLLWCCLSAQLDSGLAEAPVASIALISLYALLIGSSAGTWPRARAHLVAAVICCAGAALTKQAGWFLAAVFPILAWILLIRPCAPHGRARAAALFLSIFGVLVLAAPWYVYRQLNPADSEFGFILGGDLRGGAVHNGRSFPERAQRALWLLVHWIGGPGWVFMYVAPPALALSLLDRRWRWITLLLTAPFLAGWVFYFTYDIRNIAMALFPAGIGIAIGVGSLPSLFLARGAAIEQRKTLRQPRRLSWLVAVALVAIVIALSRGPLRDSILRRHQREQQARIFDPEINSVILAYAKDPGLRGRVITNYQILGYLPGLGDAYVFDPLHTIESVDRDLKNKGGAYILYYGGRPYPEFLDSGLASGRFTKIAEGPSPGIGSAFLFLAVNHP